MLETQQALYVVLPGMRKVHPVNLSGEVIGIAEAEDRQFALCSQSGSLVLYRREDHGRWSWAEKDHLPTELNDAGVHVLILGDGNRLVLVTDGSVFVLNPGVRSLFDLRTNDWTRFPIVAGGPQDDLATYLHQQDIRPTTADHVLLHSQDLFVGFDRGEFGGALGKIDLRSGRLIWMQNGSSQHGYPGKSPVKGIGIDAIGRVWVVQGSAGWPGVFGRIDTYRDGSWRTLCSTFATRDGRWDAVNWPFDPTGFCALAFHNGIPYVVTTQMDVVKYEKGKWVQAWVGKDPEMIPVSLMVLEPDTYLVGTAGNGVAILSGSHKTADFLALDDAFLSW